MLAALLLAAFPSGTPEPLAGYWINPSSSAVVQIAPCGANWCGTVAWASNKAKADSARGGTAQLVGTQLMQNFAAAEQGSWRGTLFVPDAKIKAPAQLKLSGADQLTVTGCALPHALCKSQTWTRTKKP